MEKHTPGPWEANMIADPAVFRIYGSNAICQTIKPSGFYRAPAETEANARLISAAPDLLEACKKAIFILENMNIQPFDLKTLKEIEAAVAKATGKS